MKILRKDFTVYWDENTSEEEKAKKDVFSFKLEGTLLSCTFTQEQRPAKEFVVDLTRYKGLCVNVNVENLEQPNTLTIYPGFTTYS